MRQFISAALACSLAPLAHADSFVDGQREVQFDVNSLELSLDPPAFSTDFTGSATLAATAGTRLAQLIVDGGLVASPDAELAFFGARFDFVDGGIDGGYVIMVFENGPDDPVTLSAGVTPGVGGVSFQTQQSFDFLLDGAVLNADELAGIDVSFLRSGRGVCGSGIAFQISAPEGFDDDVDIDLFLVEPLAASAADLDGDGVVGGADLAQLIGAWGPLP